MRLPLALLVGALLLCGCASAPRVSVEMIAPPPPRERAFATFWDAAFALDYERAHALASNDTQRRYAHALADIAEGRIEKGRALLGALAAEGEAALPARALLSAVAKESAAIADRALAGSGDRSFAEALRDARAMERLTFPAEAVTLPFERRGSATPLVPVHVSGRAAVLGLDTGAGLTVIGSELAAAVGAKRLGARTEAANVQGEGVGVELAVVDLDIGGIRFAGHPVIVIDSARLRFRVAGIEVAGFDGVLGWNAIAPLRITLDNASKTVRFERSAGRAQGRDLFWIGEPYVRARSSNGLPLILLLDTGASRSALAAALAPAAGLPGGEVKSTLVMGAGSSRRMEVTVHRDAALHVGSARVTFGELQSIEARATGYAVRDGTLGADALTNGKVVLDARAREFAIAR